MNGLNDSVSWTLADQHFGDGGPIYTENIYERATEASLDDLDDDPRPGRRGPHCSAASKPRQLPSLGKTLATTVLRQAGAVSGGRYGLLRHDV